MRKFRSLLFHALFYPYTALLAFLALPLFVLPRRHFAAAARFWASSSLRLFTLCTGITYEIRGLDRLPPTACLIASKHQSAWDVMALRALTNGVIVSKRSVFWIPLFGWGVKKAGAIGLDRGGGPAALRHLAARARRFARQDLAIMLFPEGTRRPPGAPADYKPGVAFLYRQLAIPCIPAALNSGLCWPRRSFWHRPGTITLELLEPIPPGLPRKAFMRLLIERIESASDRLAHEACAGGGQNPAPPSPARRR